MSNPRRALGQHGEDIAAAYLTGIGLVILHRNFTTRRGELDLVAVEGAELVFVEVKTRRSRLFGTGEESITYSKRRKLWLAAAHYLQVERPPQLSMRFDLIVIEYQGDRIEIRHHRNVVGPGGRGV